MPYRQYIKPNDDGTIIKEKVSPAKLSLPWVEVLPEDSVKLGMGMTKYLWDFEAQALVEKEEIKLEVASTQFPADGVTEVAISVSGETLSPDETVDISVNSEVYSITTEDPILLSSDEPGVFEVVMVDRIYTARPFRHTIIAQEPPDEN